MIWFLAFGKSRTGAPGTPGLRICFYYAVPCLPQYPYASFSTDNYGWPFSLSVNILNRPISSKIWNFRYMYIFVDKLVCFLLYIPRFYSIDYLVSRIKYIIIIYWIQFAFHKILHGIKYIWWYFEILRDCQPDKGQNSLYDHNIYKRPTYHENHERILPDLVFWKDKISNSYPAPYPNR